MPTLQAQPAILLITGNASDADAVFTTLRRHGLADDRLTVVTGVPQALEQLRRRAFDMLLLDLSAPDPNDAERIAQLREHHPDDDGILIAILSDATGQRAEEVLRLGVQDVISRRELGSDGLIRVLTYALERRETARILRESRDQLSSILDSLNDVAWAVSAETGETLYMSEAALAVYGHPVRDFLEHPDLWREVVHPDDRHLVDEYWRLLERRGQIDIEYRIIRADGRERWIYDRGRAVQDASGRIVRYEGVATDVTERRKVRTALEETSRFAQTVIDSVGQGIVVYDANLNYRVWNRYMTAMTGLEAEQVIGRNALELFPHFEEAGSAELIRRALQGETVTTGDMRFQVATTGRKGWVTSTFTPLRSADGTVTGVVGVISDVTERKRAEQQEQDRSRILENVVQNQPLELTLAELALTIERQYPGSWCSLALLENGSLRQLAAPHLPASLVEATRELSAAAPPADAVLATRSLACWHDAADDPDWNAQQQTFREQRIASIWALPITTAGGESAGLLTLYFREPTHPTPADEARLTASARLATVVLEQHALFERLNYQARHDALTGLPNRFAFEQQLIDGIAVAEREGRRLALLFIDLDRFKQINDTLGHQVGDKLLKAVAERLRFRIRRRDLLARMGGDEFAVLLTELREPAVALRIARHLIAVLEEPFEIEGHELFITASIGVSTFPDDAIDATTLLANVDRAMYQAKAQGKNNVFRFQPQLNAESLKRLELENHLRRALEKEELELHYQPKYDLATGAHVGFEALLRWRHRHLGMISPGTFIPLAEESGLIIPIGAWVLEEACRQAAAWQRQGHPPVHVGVNVSALQFNRPDFLDTVVTALEKSGLPPSYLDLEVTESVVMHDLEMVADRLQELRRLGVSISIDDFGTGYSSLAYLKHLPVDTLKIDRSFIADLDSNGPAAQQAASLIQAVVTLAHGFGLQVLAEGVETAAQQTFLASIGCDQGQGYLFAKPLPADTVWQEAKQVI